MTELHLEARHLVMIEQMLQEFIPEARVWCFGSRVHGRGLKRFSDLDLVVRDEEDMHKELGKLRDTFEASDLPIKVVLSEWNQLPDWLQRDIFKSTWCFRTLSRLPFEMAGLST